MCVQLLQASLHGKINARKMILQCTMISCKLMATGDAAMQEEGRAGPTGTWERGVVGEGVDDQQNDGI